MTLQNTVRNAILSVASLMGAAGAVSVPTMANAGPGGAPIDCAILICLSGGWPASAECSAARAEFIRRITPWPIEPPLQIWRCPMGVSYSPEQSDDPIERLFWAVQPSLAPDQSTPSSQWFAAEATTESEQPSSLALIREPFREVEAGLSPEARLHLAEAVGGGADIDISDPAFDYVRSIKVWDVRHFSHAPRGKDEECSIRSTIRLGSYGQQGDFSWATASYTQAPSWVIPSTQCSQNSGRRGVGVEWTDYAGVHGYEWVSY